MAASIFCRMNDGQVTGHFASICNEKHGKKQKPKVLALLKKAAFPANKDHQNRNFIIIGLVLLELGKFFSRHALWSQFFGLCNLGAQKHNAKKLAYAG